MSEIPIPEPVARSLDPVEYPCLCVKTHIPAIRITHAHHVIPLAWGGADLSDNIAPVCPNAHDIIHGMLRKWVKQGHPDSWDRRRNAYLYTLAMRGWEGRPQ